MPEPTLRITEVFRSIQGESTRAGSPCVFVRLTGCPLRCTYCDTEYAFREGTRRALSDVVAEVLAHDVPLVCVTGGEPLAQPAAAALVRALCDAGRAVQVETSGAVPIDACDPRAMRILDVKTPGSGEADRDLPDQRDGLRPHDEVKFVLTGRDDYVFAREVIRSERLAERCAAVLLSPVFGQPRGLEIAGAAALDPARLAAWILEDALPVRLQLQLHKFIWDPAARGV